MARRCRLVEADALARFGRTLDAVSLLGEVRDEARATGDRVALGRARALLSTCLDELGERTASLAEAEAAYELLDEETPEHLRVDHTMVLALLTSLHRAGSVSFELFDHALALARRLGEPVLTVAVLNNYAWILHDKRELAAAREAVTELVRVSEAAGLPLPLVVLDTVARIMAETGELAAAEALLDAAVRGELPAPDTDSTALPASLLTLALIARRQGRREEARRLLEECRRLAERRRLYRHEGEALGELAALYAEEGRFEEAYEAHRRYHERFVALRSLEAEAEAAALQALHGTAIALERSRELDQLARRDPLTGLWNRRHLADRIGALVDAARRHRQPLSLALGDVDGFKRLNDEHSHATGDHVLVVVGSLLEGLVEEPSFAVRFGGEEFLAVLPGYDLAAAASFAERWRSAVRAQPWRATLGVPGVTISVGVAELGPTDDVSFLVAAADARMYAAKRAGRDRVVAGATPAPR